MDGAALKAWLALCRAPGVGSVAVSRLLESFGSAEAAVGASSSALRAIGLSGAQIDALKKPDAAGIAADLAWLDAAGRGVLTIADAAYPAALRQIAAAPPLLFWQGDVELLGMPQLAIVGSRAATPQGLDNARAFAAELARRGLIITSGLALGIDGAAHRGALEGGGYTVAVCATGLDRVYPARHKALAHEIAARGVLVSEFPSGVQALAENFPRRNRIISGLSLGVLVVEAARESGSLITARYALEQGRELFAIPGSIHNPQARGCHALIRQGARLVETVDDLLEELGPLLRPWLGTRLAEQMPTAAEAPLAGDDPAAAAILAALGDELLTLDALVERTGQTVADLQTALTILELQGRIAPAAGGRYQRLPPR
ncbi:DNA-processing protein DprA [Solimonas soli]|uniref:DNA-processing protein DprA n=1 Tax=Solimonas soli TaxID=413479 RepID=UPI000483CA9E|nr:DNA-processing protein DprA [Solimonas soli]